MSLMLVNSQVYWPKFYKRLWPTWEYVDTDQEWVGRYTEVWFSFGPIQRYYYAPYGWRRNG